MLFMLLLMSGIFCIIAGSLVTRLTWRPDIEPFGRMSRTIQTALHPENFAKPDRLREIRLLNLVGLLLLCGALVVVLVDVFRSIARP
jgi:hypothetical protein